VPIAAMEKPISSSTTSASPHNGAETRSAANGST